MAGENILIVEDDPEISDIVSTYLAKHGFGVRTTDGWDAVSILRDEGIDLVLLDILLPGPDGFELCQELRKLADVPIVFMSAKSEDSDKILALGLGGDDFIAKPFSPAELVARVKAQLRRYRGMLNGQSVRGALLRIAGMEIDEEHFTVRVRDSTVALSAKEFQLLTLMAQHPERIFKPEELFQHVWESPSLGDSRTVMVHISNLRKKIEQDPSHPRYIITIRGIGYKFMGEAAAQ